MKLTKKQIKALDTIKYHLDRADRYIKRDDVVGIAVKTQSPNGSSYIIKNIECVSESSHQAFAVDVVNKNSGSDLTGLFTARQLLADFLKEV